MPFRQLQVKLQKRAGKTHLEKKQTTKEVLSNIFASLQVGKKVWLMFWRPNDSMKGKSYEFSGYKQKKGVFGVLRV